MSSEDGKNPGMDECPGNQALPKLPDRAGSNRARASTASTAGYACHEAAGLPRCYWHAPSPQFSCVHAGHLAASPIGFATR